MAAGGTAPAWAHAEPRPVASEERGIAARQRPVVHESGIAAALRWGAERTGTVAWAVAQPDGRLRGHNLDAPFRCASVCKAMLMAAVLRAARTRPLTPDEQALLAPMITRSQNKAARTLYAAYGDAALDEVAGAARMTHFRTVGALFETRITAADQARLFLRIDRLVPARHRAYARALLAGIVPAQRWGIVPGAQRRGFTAFLKGGWRRGITHQVALLERDGRRIALAVLTSDAPSQAYGRATLAGVTARVLTEPA